MGERQQEETTDLGMGHKRGSDVPNPRSHPSGGI